MQTLEIYVTQVPFLNTLGEELKMHWETILSSLTPRTLASRLFNLGVILSSSARACSLAFCQPVKSCEICLIDMTMQDISCCRAIGLARNEHARDVRSLAFSSEPRTSLTHLPIQHLYTLQKSNVSTLFPVCNMPVITRIF